MNDKKNFVILLVIMVVLIGGAYALYNALGDKMEMPGLVVQNGGQGEDVESSGSVQAGESNQGGGSGQTDGGSQGSENSQSSGSAQDGKTNGSDTGENAGENAQAGDTGAARELAPDFTVYDGEGNAYSLSDFRGKPVIVNFWASWCGPCKSEMPDFQELYELYGKEIHFLMVNMTDGAQETVESASEFISQSGYTFPIYYDTDMDAAITYGVYSIPTTYFFDAEGYGIAYGQGAMDKETIQAGIDMIYSE